MVKLLKYLPLNWISLLCGRLVHLRLPPPWRKWSISLFVFFYKINQEEAEKPLDQYQSIGDFFVRRLKPKARPVEEGEALHPADSLLTAVGRIQRGKIFQVKHWPYSVEEILSKQHQSDYKQSEEINKEIQGLENGFFATYYLCPADYHRVHSPVTGEIKEVRKIPGRLWPVHQSSVNAVENLFAVNERVVVRIQTQRGTVWCVFVGALNVGKIEMIYASSSIKAGDELGLFRMGSTFVVFYPKTFEDDLRPDVFLSWQGKKVRVNTSVSRCP